MTCNVGTADRVVRVLIGLGLLAIGALSRSWWGLLGLAPLANAASGWCGLYQALGFSTAKQPPGSEDGHRTGPRPG